MPGSQSWKTAFLVASARLQEQYQPPKLRLFADPVIKIFFSRLTLFLLSFKIFRAMETMVFQLTAKGVLGSLLCRTKYIDDSCKAAIDAGIDQIVILGAGLDTRPYRIAGINKVKILEIDLPAIQNIKKKKLKQFLGALPANITYIPIDFNIQTLAEALSATELDLAKRIFFIWEGVTPYITAEAVKNTLSFIAKSSPGSILVFTYILKSVIDKTSAIPGADNLLQYFEEKDQAWIFGLEPSGLSDFLQQFNLTLVEDITASYYRENYLKPLKRDLPVAEFERIAYARII